MKIALAYGNFSAGGNGPYDTTKLYVDKGLTGSESFYFNTVKGLAERGHTVTAYFPCWNETDFSDELGGAKVQNVEKLSTSDAEVFFSWNEPDLLRVVPPSAIRICIQQLNDFPYCQSGYNDFVDLWAAPSEVHRQYLISIGGFPHDKAIVMPNCLNEEFYSSDHVVARDPYSIAYCSSPDRGLHWLLELFPQVRKQVPKATLKIYYKIHPWLTQFKDTWGSGPMLKQGLRARYIQEAIQRLGTMGENGVTVVGPVSNVEMAKQLMATRMLAYPCDTVSFTEGFSVSIMDACAAGCVPVISDCDAIGSVYKDVAHVIPGKPADNRTEWVKTMVSVLSGESKWNEVITRSKAFTKGFTRQVRAAQWETVIAGVQAWKPSVS